MDPNQPYAPPTQDHTGGAAAPVGSLPLGLLAGFFGGCIGLILVYVIAKGEQTKRGAAIGFVAQMAVGFALRAIM